MNKAVWLLGMLCVFAVVTHANDADKSGEVELQDGTWKDVTQYVAAHRGQVVVVDIWSTSCLPCMKEFPKLVALQKQHPMKLRCVSMNIDYAGIKSKPPSYYRERVTGFLKKRNATIRNYLCSVASDELFQELDLPSIPAVYVFGPDGKLAKRFDSSTLKEGSEEAFSYESDINPLVAELIE